MLGWITKLFGSFDRQQDAANRAATAMEQIADDVEAMRDAIRARLAGEVVQSIPEELHTNGTNGRKVKVR